jgi:hypothetical protein
MSPLRVIWNADVLVDTNVLSRASRSEGRFWMLANTLRRMTAHPKMGSAHFSIASIHEWLASESQATQLQYLRTYRRLYKLLPNRIRVLGDIRQLIEGEWARPPHSRGIRGEFLEDAIVQAVAQGTTTGTFFEKARESYVAWKKARQPGYAEEQTRFQHAYKTNETFRRSVQQALRHLGPDSFTICDDLAARLIRDEGKRPESDVKIALGTPGKYLSTWTFALLRRLMQIAQTFPSDFRSFGGERFLDILKPSPSDFTDAEIAASGARCGILITEDKTLRARVDLLWNAELIRLQAVDSYEAAFDFPDTPPDFENASDEMARLQDWPVPRFAKGHR